MQYREFGSTGQKISALGFGCMRLPEIEKNGEWFVDEELAIPMLQQAVQLGVNYFDTGFYYCHHNSEKTVGKALKACREQVMLSTKLPMGWAKGPGDMRRGLEKSLREMDTSYIDFYHFWSLDRNSFDEKVMGYNLLAEAQQAKEEGLIRHISFSFHDEAKTIQHIIDTGEVFESMLVQYNLLDRSNEEMIAYAAEKGLGVVAMGPVAGGRLAAPTQLGEKLLGSAGGTTYELALKFVLGNPGISCALSGMQSMQMLHSNVAVASEKAPLSTEEWQQLGTALEQLKAFSDLYCTGCKYCQPCPAEIDIPKLFALYTYHNVYGLSEYAKKEFAKHLQEDKKTSKDCTACGFCERSCPQKLEVRAQLARVEEILANLA